MSRETDIMSDEQIRKVLEELRKVRNHCDYSNCGTCSFNTYRSCVFFNKPWEWGLGEVEEKL